MGRYRRRNTKSEKPYSKMPFSAWEIPYGETDKEIYRIIFCNALRDYVQSDVYPKKTEISDGEKIYILDINQNKRVASLEMRKDSMVAVLPRNIDAEYIYEMFGVKPKRKM